MKKHCLLFPILFFYSHLFCQQKIFQGHAIPTSIQFITNDSLAADAISLNFDEDYLEKFSRYNFSKFVNVKDVQLGYFTDSAFRKMLKKIAAIPHLEKLEITTYPLMWPRGVKQKEDSFPSLIRNLKTLKTLQLTWVKNYDWNDIIEKVAGIKSLQNFQISIAPFEIFPTNFYKLSFLNALSLKGISDAAVLPDLSSFYHLKYLELADNPKTDYDQILKQLSNIPLEELVLESASSEKLPSSIENLKNLKSFTCNLRKIKDQTNLFDVLGSLQKLTYLRLYIDSLQLFPSIQKLQALETLDVSYDKIKSLPDEIGTLKSLRLISIQANSISAFPPSFFNLSSLEEINASNCSFKEIPKEIGKLLKLKKIDFSRNQVVHIPSEIGDLKNLETVFLVNNKIDALPESLSECKKLKAMNIANNKIEKLPDEFGNLSFLTSLIADNNKLNELPNGLVRLSLLENLSLLNNNIHVLPSSFGNLKSLKTLNLWGNAIYDLPEDIGSLKNLEDFQVNVPVKYANNDSTLKRLPPSFAALGKLRILIMENLPRLDGDAAIRIVQHLKGTADRVMLNNCNISQLPKEGWGICNIKWLDLEDNHISEVPANIVKAPLLNYLRLRKNPLPAILEFSFESKGELVLALMEAGIIKDSSVIMSTPGMCKALLTSANIGIIYRKEYEKFIRYYNLAERVCPNIKESNEWRYRDLGTAQFYMGDYKGAINSLSSTLQADTSGNFQIMNFTEPEFDLLAKSYMALEDTSGAMEVYKKWATSERNPSAATRVGIYYQNKGNEQEANKWFRYSIDDYEIRNSANPLEKLSLLEVFTIANKQDSIILFVKKTDTSNYNIVQKLLYEYLLIVHKIVIGKLSELELKSFEKKMQEISEQKIEWSYELFEYWIDTLNDVKVRDKILHLHQIVRSKLHV